MAFPSWLGRLEPASLLLDRVPQWFRLRLAGAPPPRQMYLQVRKVLCSRRDLAIECLDLSGPRRPDHSVDKRRCGGTETGDRHITGIGALFVRSSGAEADEEGLLAAK